MAQKPLKGTRDIPGALLAMAERGHGRAAVVTDSGWPSDDALRGRGIGGVAVSGQDNFESFRRLSHWLAGDAHP